LIINHIASIPPRPFFHQIHNCKNRSLAAEN
jgi:hypothetical protein